MVSVLLFSGFSFPEFNFWGELEVQTSKFKYVSHVFGKEIIKNLLGLQGKTITF